MMIQFRRLISRLALAASSQRGSYGWFAGGGGTQTLALASYLFGGGRERLHNFGLPEIATVDFSFPCQFSPSDRHHHVLLSLSPSLSLDHPLLNHLKKQRREICSNKRGRESPLLPSFLKKSPSLKARERRGHKPLHATFFQKTDSYSHFL